MATAVHNRSPSLTDPQGQPRHSVVLAAEAFAMSLPYCRGLDGRAVAEMVTLLENFSREKTLDYGTMSNQKSSPDLEKWAVDLLLAHSALVCFTGRDPAPKSRLTALAVTVGYAPVEISSFFASSKRPRRILHPSQVSQQIANTREGPTYLQIAPIADVAMMLQNVHLTRAVTAWLRKPFGVARRERLRADDLLQLLTAAVDTGALEEPLGRALLSELVGVMSDVVSDKTELLLEVCCDVAHLRSSLQAIAARRGFYKEPEGGPRSLASSQALGALDALIAASDGRVRASPGTSLAAREPQLALRTAAAASLYTRHHSLRQRYAVPVVVAAATTGHQHPSPSLQQRETQLRLERCVDVLAAYVRGGGQHPWALNLFAEDLGKELESIEIQPPLVL